MSYKYDIFISYNHSVIDDWLVEHFIPLSVWHFESSLGYRPEIFIDRDGILTGDSWPERLSNALSHSKCLMAILSPSYFNSTWCIYELTTMLKREEQNGFRIKKKPEGLIIPINVSNGRSFPEIIKNIQYFDCRDYVIKGDAFKSSPIYVDFQRKIKTWSADVAKCIENAPIWKKEWTDQKIETIINISKPHFKPPILE